MNGREAIQAMLAGKMVVRGSDPYPVRFGSAGVECRSPEGWIKWSFCGDGTYELYEEPNPHAPGTYQWAREEHARGKSVRNAIGPGYYANTDSWDNFRFLAAEFETKTWRHA